MSPRELAVHIENSDLSEWTYPLRPPGWRRANGSPSYADKLRLLLMEEIYEISEDMSTVASTLRTTFFKQPRSPAGEAAAAVTAQRDPRLNSRTPGGLRVWWDESRTPGPLWLNDAPRIARSSRSALTQSLHHSQTF